MCIRAKTTEIFGLLKASMSDGCSTLGIWRKLMSLLEITEGEKSKGTKTILVPNANFLDFCNAHIANNNGNAKRLSGESPCTRRRPPPLHAFSFIDSEQESTKVDGDEIMNEACIIGNPHTNDIQSPTTSARGEVVASSVVHTPPMKREGRIPTTTVCNYSGKFITGKSHRRSLSMKRKGFSSSLGATRSNGSSGGFAVRIVKRTMIRKESSLKRKSVCRIFLICWVPFFSMNILNAICIKIDSEVCQIGYGPFFYSTWIGYMNSFMNPIIYTIFNTEFRRAFKSILLGRKQSRGRMRLPTFDKGMRQQVHL
uniref:G-protein coupled receptors family 1 profile domain-containing protein n=1 Tax=Parascaris equorum TaxID=6256 RepID=A0A914RQ74_PAREQ